MTGNLIDNVNPKDAPPIGKPEDDQPHKHGSFDPFGNCLLCAECTR